MSQPTWWRGGRGMPSLIALLHIANRTSERVRLIPPKYAPDASQRAGWEFLHPSQCIRPTFTVIYTHLSTLLCITTKSLSVT